MPNKDPRELHDPATTSSFINNNPTAPNNPVNTFHRNNDSVGCIKTFQKERVSLARLLRMFPPNGDQRIVPYRAPEQQIVLRALSRRD